MKKKIILISAAALGTVIITAGAAALFYFSQSVSYSETLTAGVSSQVTIRRDKNGVPQIKAGSPGDMYFALGYLHAQDMLALLEYYRALANADASQLIGPQGDKLEKLARIIGFKRRTAQILPKLKPADLASLTAYTAGINFSKSRGNILKNDSRRLWEPADVISVFILLEWSNSYLNNRELIFQIPYDKSLTLQKELFPKNITKIYNEGEEASLAVINNLKDLLLKHVGSFNRGMAFTVSGKNLKSGESAAGYTLSSELSVYPGWYPLHIEIPEMKISAVTHAGMPFIFSGIRDNLRFFRISADIDTQDILIENVKKVNDQIQFQSAGGWKKLNPSRDSDGSKNYIIWETDNGPIINDIFSNEEYANFVVTLRSQFPDEYALASLLALPFARDMKDAADTAARSNGMPAIYLFSSGDTSMKTYCGKFAKTPETKYIFQQGSTVPKQVFTDLSRFSRTYNSRSIIITSGNGDDLPADIKEFLLEDNTLGQLFEETAGRNIIMKDEDVSLLITDTRSMRAKNFIPLLITLLNANPVTSSKLARLYFTDWDSRFDPDKPAPSIYTSIILTFIKETLADDYPESIDSIIRNHKYLIPNFFELVKSGQSTYFNDSRTDNFETRDTIFDRAFFKSLRILNRKMGPVMSEWTWGNVHRGHFKIPYNESSVFGKSLYSIKDSEFPGAADSFAISDTGDDLVPLSAASISLYDLKSRRGLIMRYSYSINPVSEFYYGRMAGFHDKNFNSHNGLYMTVINTDGKNIQADKK